MAASARDARQQLDSPCVGVDKSSELGEHLWGLPEELPMHELRKQAPRRSVDWRRSLASEHGGTPVHDYKQQRHSLTSRDATWRWHRTAPRQARTGLTICRAYWPRMACRYERALSSSTRSSSSLLPAGAVTPNSASQSDRCPSACCSDAETTPCPYAQPPHVWRTHRR